MKLSLSLRFPPANPPIAAIAAAGLAALEKPTGSTVLVRPDGKAKESVLVLTSPTQGSLVVKGAEAIERCVSRFAPGVYGSGDGEDPMVGCQIERMVVFAQELSQMDEKAKMAQFSVLNDHLACRSTLCGYDLTLADCKVWAALLADAGCVKRLSKGSGVIHLKRWWDYVSSCSAFAQAKRALEASQRKKPAPKKGGSFDIPLEGAEMGKVVTRFPPEPSGYLHIGHAKAALLNDYFARTWKGKCLLRFDDTNPEKESQEFVDNIMSDLKTLGIKHTPPTTTSDHFGVIAEKAEEMIKKGFAYVDDTPVELMREQRMNGIESASRKMSIDEHLRRWGEMKKGSEYGLKCVLRAKISMTHVNKCMRDPAMYRCKIQTHHKTGDKYKVYPTYDFACPIVDSIEGVTHALRTVEYKDRDQQYNWFIEKLGIRPVHIWSYSRLNMRYTVLSKRKLKAFVQEGTVEGWNDPRFPTVQGVIRRGLRVDALREFILEVGASVNDNMMSWDKVWAINKKKIDPVAHRFLAITRDSKVMMTITNFTEPAPVSAAGATTMDVQLHPKNKGIGMKKTAIGDKIWLEAEDASLFTEGEEVTLMRWGNCRITKITKDSEGKITELKGALNLMGDVKKTKYKVTWIADAADGSDAKRQPVSVTCVEFDHLITKPKLEDGDDYKNFVTGCSRFETHVQGEPALRNVRPGQLIQLERRGYFRCDKALEPGTDGTIVLFNIPTGKKKSMSSVGSKVAMKR